LVAASGIVPGASNFFHEGNNFNFRSNSTGFFFGGGSSWVNPTARFHVRGDGTNPIFRFENNTGTASLQMTNSGSLTLSEGNLTIGNGGITAFGKITTNGGYNNISGTPVTSLDLNNTIANSAGSSNTRIASMQYTINNSGTQSGSVTGIFMNVTETNLNGVTSDFINFQRNGSTTLRIGSTGNITASNTIQTVDINLTGGQQAIWNSAGRILLTNNSFNGFNILQIGGVTNLHPAIKKNGTTLEVRLADDSAYTQLGVGSLAMAGYHFASLATRYVFDIDTRGSVFLGNFGIKGSNTANHESAILDVESTTKGFLLPRMTTAQRDAIAGPAEGLEIYNTTEKAKQYWNGIAWKTILTA